MNLETVIIDESTDESTYSVKEHLSRTYGRNELLRRKDKKSPGYNADTF